MNIYRRSIALTPVLLEQMQILLKHTGENTNRLICRLISEEYIREMLKNNLDKQPKN